MTELSAGILGYGISTRLTDNEYDLLVLKNGFVHILSESDYYSNGFKDIDKSDKITYEDYIKKERTWENIKEG